MRKQTTKIAAVITAFTFTFSNSIGFSQHAAPLAESVTGISQNPDLSRTAKSIFPKAQFVPPDLNPYLITIPEGAGKIEEVYQGNPTEPFIIHIQNVHANYEAQKNIKLILGHLVKKHSVQLIQVEGAVSKKLDPEVLKPSYLEEAKDRKSVV